MPDLVKILIGVALISGEFAFLLSATESTPLRVEIGYYLIGLLLPVVGLLPAALHRRRSR